MKSLILFLLAATALNAFANMEFVLDCERLSNRVGAPRYQVVKKAFKKNEKWSFKYYIRQKPLNPMAEATDVLLVSANSGDEDYNEYRTKSAPEGFPFTTASIQNKFAWASIEGDDVGSLRCEP